MLFRNFRFVISHCRRYRPLLRIARDFAIVVVCCRSGISDSVYAAAVVVACFRSSISESSCAAASCSPVELFSSSSFLCSTSCRFAEELGISCGFNDAGYLVCFVSLQGLCFCLFASKSSFFLEGGNPMCAVTESRRLPPRQCSILCFSVDYHVVQLFLVSTWGFEGVLFFGRLFESCIECHVVL